MQSPNIVLDGLCKVKTAEVTVSDASAHTVPTYNTTPLTVKSSTNVLLIVSGIPGTPEGLLLFS